MHKLIVILSILLIPLPSLLKVMVLRMLGNKVAWSSKIGYSLINLRTKLTIGEHAQIKNFNYIDCKSFSMENNSVVRNFNYFNGIFIVELRSCCSIGSFNKFFRGPREIVRGVSKIAFNKGTSVTNRHSFDLTRSISIGEMCSIGGLGSQFWTHGFFHRQDRTRFRVDGKILIGNNVYISSSCMILPNVHIGDDISVGSGSVVSKNISDKGMYVSSGLRFIPYAELNESMVITLTNPEIGLYVHEK